MTYFIITSISVYPFDRAIKIIMSNIIKMEEEVKIDQEETKSPDPTPSEVFERIEYSKPEFWNDRFRE